MFPFFLALLPPSSPHLGSMLDALRDPEQLWSPYGLRSLSASHPEFGLGENYWKGPVWVQMNYLALRALYKVACSFTALVKSDGWQKYAAEEGPYRARAQEIYQELRKNVIDNVFKVSLPLSFYW
jgi:mannosyl-oligosaccharide glucosidase